MIGVWGWICEFVKEDMLVVIREYGLIWVLWWIFCDSIWRDDGYLWLNGG